MKAVVPLLVAVLVIGILNLIQGFGVFGGGGGGGGATATADRSYNYAVYGVEEVGLMIKYLIDEDFKKEGKTEYPAAILQDPRITLPRLMNYMSEEGWELVEIKDNGLHFFRRPVDSTIGQPGEPRLSQKATEESDAGKGGAADGAAQPADGATAPADGAAAPAAPATPAPAAPQ